MDTFINIRIRVAQYGSGDRAESDARRWAEELIAGHLSAPEGHTVQIVCDRRSIESMTVEQQAVDPSVESALELIKREHERRCLEVTQMDAGDEGSWVRCTKDRDHAGNLHTARDLRWWTS